MGISMTRIDGVGATRRHAAVALRFLLGGVAALRARFLIEAIARNVVDPQSRLARHVALDRMALRTGPRHWRWDARTTGLQQQQHAEDDG
jgi:hypothetical protein